MSHAMSIMLINFILALITNCDLVIYCRIITKSQFIQLQ